MGRRYWYGIIQIIKRNQDYRTKCFFKYEYKEKQYERYNGKLQSDTIAGITYFQFDSLRIYLGGDALKFKDVFSSGVLSPQMIYCEMDSSCKVPQGIVWLNAITGEPLERSFHGWKGPRLFIMDITELGNVSTPPFRKRFKFRISGAEHGGGAAIWFFELTNPTKEVPIQEFIKDSKLTFLKGGWGEI